MKKLIKRIIIMMIFIFCLLGTIERCHAETIPNAVVEIEEQYEEYQSEVLSVLSDMIKFLIVLCVLVAVSIILFVLYKMWG